MDVYQGIVKDNVVLLDADVRLADGLAVEVRVPATARSVNDLLRARGLLLGTNLAAPSASPTDRRPIVVEGRPLSEQIIAERR